MAVTTGDTVSTLNGLYKEKYAESILSLIPDSARLVQRIKFSRATMVGNYYHQPVILQNETGFTYQQANAGVYSLNPAAPMQSQDAQVVPTQIVLRTAVAYEAVNRAKSAGPEAFEAATLMILKNMVESHTARLEMAMLYGGAGLATFVSSSNVSATVTKVTVTTSQWAPGLWQGQRNAFLDFYNGSSLVTSNGSISAGTATKLTAVDPNLMVLTITGVAADITALDAAIAANPNVITAFWGGAKGNEMIGLNTILTNTGTLFNVDASLYDLWQSNVFDAGSSALSQSIINSAIGVACGRGLDEDVVCYVNPATWANVMTSQAALRMYDDSYKSGEFENGATGITFKAQNGSVEVLAHPMVKAGDAFILPLARCKRIGAVDVTFQQPGLEAAEPFTPLEGYAGMQIVNYSSQQVFVEMPARAVKIINIVNS